MHNKLDLEDFLQTILDDTDSIGRFIGVADLFQNCWSLYVYFGNQRLAVLYNGQTQSLDSNNFEQLLSEKHLVKTDFLRLKFSTFVEFDSFRDHSRRQRFEFFVYKSLNLFTTCVLQKIKTADFVSVLRVNLDRMRHFDEGDIISFERGFYSHHALLTDKARMIVTHRWGEPENPTEIRVALPSLFGLPTEKALVSEDHLMEVAGHRKCEKSNHLYDPANPPVRTKEEIVAEAKRRLGEKGYSITKQNCQHFVSDVRNGTCCSPEVEGVVQGAFWTAVAGSLLIAGLALYSTLTSRSSNMTSTKNNAIKDKDDGNKEDKSKEKVLPM